MALPTEIHPFAIAGGGNQYQVANSLRFRSSATAYLSRTSTTTATNPKIGTLSLWVKRGALTATTGNSQYLIQTGNSSTSDSGHFTMFFTTTDSLSLGQYSWAGYSTPQVFRDPSAWYHIVLSYNSTLASNNLTIYVNGASIGATTVVQNTNWAILSGTEAINIGRHTVVGRTFDGYLAEVYLIDGQALTPSSFGAYDVNGVWQPARYTGTYGTNGFYLAYSDPTGSGSGNDTYTKLLLHGNGLNDSAWNGSSNHALTAYGSATTSTTQTKFGMSSSLYTLGSSLQYFRTDASADFKYAATSGSTNDFTFDFWFYPGASGTTSPVIGIADTTYSSLLIYTTQFYASSNNTSWDIASIKAMGTPTSGQWNHYAIVRSGSTWYIFLNGVQQDTWTNSSAGYDYTTNNFLQFGRAQGGSLYSTGYYAEARWSAGISRWTSAFTPPTAPYSGGSGSDSSGNVNAWRPFNINTSSSGTTYDSMIDSPTNYDDGGNGRGNYLTINPLVTRSYWTVSNGNLTWTNASGAADQYAIDGWASITSQYYEFMATTIPASSVYIYAGDNNSYYCSNGQIYAGGSLATTVATFTSGDVLSFAVTSGVSTKIYKNGSLLYTSSYGSCYPLLNGYGGTVWNLNFGQRPFAYPSLSVGYKTLNTYNLPNPSLPLV